MRAACLICSLILLLACRAQAARAADVPGPDPFKHLVDIGGGRRLNLVCMGPTREQDRAPTIVFLQGLGSDITDWDTLFRPASSLGRACFYDRAGMGYSDPTDRPATADNVADDLHALLNAAGIATPVILVGHSLGGLFATFYTDKFRADVAGLVLVDPSFAGQYRYALGRDDLNYMARTGDKWMAQMQACADLAAAGRLTRTDRHDCFRMPQNVTPAEAPELDYYLQQFTRPATYAARLSEYRNFYPASGPAPDADGISGAQERASARGFGALPMVVLTAGIANHDPKLSEDANNAMRGVWKDGHDRLAARSSLGESLTVPGTHHFIHASRPLVVIGAIRKVIAEADVQ